MGKERKQEARKQKKEGLGTEEKHDGEYRRIF